MLMKVTNELVSLRKKLGLDGKVYMLGNREDIPDVVNAFDLATLTSFRRSLSINTGRSNGFWNTLRSNRCG